MNAFKHITVLLACLMLSVAGHAVQIRREPGHRIPEYILPTDHDNPSLWTPKSRLMTRGAAPGDYANSALPKTGIQEYILVLVDFNNRTFITTDTTALLKKYNRVFNEHGYSDTSVFTRNGVVYHGATGSVSDYFMEQSYGQYTPKFRIVGPIHLSKGYDYYGKGYYDNNIGLMIREICDTLMNKGLVDLRGYSRDGSIDQFSIIYAGKGANYTGADDNTIWPHASTIYYNKYGIGDIKYICSCELFWDTDSILDGIGTFCHEFSHTLGLPDFYNTQSEAESSSNAAMGYWSIMDYGNYENGGFSPVGYTAFEKYSLGWMELEDITYAGTYTLNNITCKPDSAADIHSAYRLNTGNDDQFIILENHLKTGWYKYHASQGLMVTAVDYNKNNWSSDWNNVNDGPKRYCILPADNDCKRVTNAGDLFPYQGKDSITTQGSPQLKAGESYPLYSIYNITLRDSLVTFYAGPDKLSKVNNLAETQISIGILDGELSVTAPVGSIVTVHDISGKPASRTVTTAPVQTIPLPDSGIWIVKCGNITRKVRL